jgi:hypothetical protein
MRIKCLCACAVASACSSVNPSERPDPDVATIQPAARLAEKCSMGADAAVAVSGADEPVAVRDVAEDPDRFLGRLVLLHGFARFRFEATYICPGSTDCKKGSAIWLEFTYERTSEAKRALVQSWRSCDSKVVEVYGTVRLSDPHVNQGMPALDVVSVREAN